MREDKLDPIFIHDWTHTYFLQTLKFLEQRFSDPDADLVLANKIFVVMSCSPGSSLSNFCLPLTLGAGPIHLVVIDKTVCNCCQLDASEKAGVLLHEFGHILNEPRAMARTDKYADDFYADYYVKKINMGRFLIQSLEKIMKSNLPWIDEGKINLFRERISRLSDSNQVPLNGYIRELKS
jgi:hypothetical protein